MTTRIDKNCIVRSSDQDTKIPDCLFGEFLQKTITACDPNKVMMIDAITDQKRTYGALNQIALELAGGLLKLGLESHDRVMFYARNSVDYFDLYVALAYLGTTFSPSKPANGHYETQQQLLDLQAKVLVISPDKLGIVRQMLCSGDNDMQQKSISMLKLLVVLELKENELKKSEDYVEIVRHLNRPRFVQTFEQILQIGHQSPLTKVPHFVRKSFETDHAATIVYTSGTSGLAKGAILSHRALIASIQNYSRVHSLLTCFGGSVANVYPFGHISGTLFTPAFLTLQMTIVIYSSSTTTDYLLKSIEKYRIQILPLLQNVSNDLYTNYDTYRTIYDLSSIRLMYFCGSKFPKHIVDTIKEKYQITMIDEFYGATEFMGSVFNRNDDDDGGGGQFPYGSVGSPAANIEMKIIDLKSGQCLPANQTGEICMRGPNCFSGYLNNPNATAETIDCDGWYHSGDVGYYDSKGRLFIADRIKELIKYKHWSVAPADIEVFLQSHRAVSGACVIGVPHRTEGYHLRAYVCLVDGKSATKQELIDYVKDNMGYHKRLNGGVEFVPEIPRTIIGKIDRTYFKKLIQNELLTDLALVD